MMGRIFVFSLGIICGLLEKILYFIKPKNIAQTQSKYYVIMIHRYLIFNSEIHTVIIIK